MFFIIKCSISFPAFTFINLAEVCIHVQTMCLSLSVFSGNRDFLLEVMDFMFLCLFSIEIYTIQGNSHGSPCYFPFLYDGQWFHSCTSVGREDGFHWCATTHDYGKDQRWGFCPVKSEWIQLILLTSFIELTCSIQSVLLLSGSWNVRLLYIIVHVFLQTKMHLSLFPKVLTVRRFGT